MKTNRRKLFGLLGGALALPFVAFPKPVEAAPSPIIAKYKGKLEWDAGFYYCPYMPLEM